MMPSPLGFFSALLLFLVCSFGPGFFFVRNKNFSPLEKISLSFGLSFLLLYIASFTLYLLNLPPPFYYGITLGCFALFLISFRDFKNLLKTPAFSKPFIYFGFLTLWTLIQLALIRNYSRGNWVGDWFEHYQRSLFFLDHFDYNFQFIQLYWLPARPPLMNLLCSFFMVQTGSDFFYYQLFTLFLSLTVFFSFCLIVQLFSTRKRIYFVIPLVFFMLNPMMMNNLTYSWTRLEPGVELYF